MRPETRRAFHFGINFIVSPIPEFTPSLFLAFQKHLAESSEGLVFDRVSTQGAKLVLHREKPRLQVTVGPAGAGATPVAQLLIVAPEPERLLTDFVHEAEEVVAGYQATWPGPVQILRRDSTIRYLYAVAGDHSFQFLWETRLGQSEENLGSLQRVVVGGGLRLVMPGVPQEDEAHVEVKVESYLKDSSLLFVETQFAWEQVLPRGSELDPGGLLRQVDGYATGPVEEFIAVEGGPDAQTA